MDWRAVFSQAASEAKKQLHLELFLRLMSSERIARLAAMSDSEITLLDEARVNAGGAPCETSRDALLTLHMVPFFAVPPQLFIVALTLKHTKSSKDTRRALKEEVEYWEARASSQPQSRRVLLYQIQLGRQCMDLWGDSWGKEWGKQRAVNAMSAVPNQRKLLTFGSAPVLAAYPALAFAPSVTRELLLTRGWPSLDAIRAFSAATQLRDIWHEYERCTTTATSPELCAMRRFFGRYDLQGKLCEALRKSNKQMEHVETLTRCLWDLTPIELPQVVRSAVKRDLLKTKPDSVEERVSGLFKALAIEMLDHKHTVATKDFLRKFFIWYDLQGKLCKALRKKQMDCIEVLMNCVWDLAPIELPEIVRGAVQRDLLGATDEQIKLLLPELFKALATEMLDHEREWTMDYFLRRLSNATWSLNHIKHCAPSAGLPTRLQVVCGCHKDTRFHAVVRGEESLEGIMCSALECADMLLVKETLAVAAQARSSPVASERALEVLLELIDDDADAADFSWRHVIDLARLDGVDCMSAVLECLVYAWEYPAHRHVEDVRALVCVARVASDSVLTRLVNGKVVTRLQVLCSEHKDRRFHAVALGKQSLTDLFAAAVDAGDFVLAEAAADVGARSGHAVGDAAMFQYVITDAPVELRERTLPLLWKPHLSRIAALQEVLLMDDLFSFGAESYVDAALRFQPLNALPTDTPGGFRTATIETPTSTPCSPDTSDEEYSDYEFVMHMEGITRFNASRRVAEIPDDILRDPRLATCAVVRGKTASVVGELLQRGVEIDHRWLLGLAASCGRVAGVKWLLALPDWSPMALHVVEAALLAAARGYDDIVDVCLNALAAWESTNTSL